MLRQRIKLGAMAAAAACLLAQGLGAQSVNPKWLREYAQLNAKAGRQQGHDLAETLARMAEYDFSFARASYHDHDAAGGAEHLDEAGRHADHACALLQEEVAQHKKDGMKNVEKSLQAVGFGLQGLAETVRLEDRARVKAAQSHFADLRAQVLQWLFAPK
ncbi:MAG TPA: hypothetical protein VFP94_10100 [Terriglobales bacterium]|nr:hypothetical protein [Terriglobales bacterium]